MQRIALPSCSAECGDWNSGSTHAGQYDRTASTARSEHGRAGDVMKIAMAVVLASALFKPAHATLMDGAAPAYALAPQAFSSAQDGLVNPTLTFTNVPGYGTLAFSYGPYFQGQSATDPSSPPTSVSGTAAPPLSLTTDTVWQTVIETDFNNPVANAEVLGGVPVPATNGFGGPVALLFSQPVTEVTLTAGYLDNVGSTTIRGYAADGTLLGAVSSTQPGYETFNLADSAGRAISGLLITTVDEGGFGIDGVGIGRATTPQPVPGPASFAILPAMIFGLFRRRARP